HRTTLSSMSAFVNPTWGNERLMLVVSELHVSYGVVNAVYGVSLRAKPGTVTLVIGANGAGKTTTLRALAGYLRPKSGSIRLNGNDVTNKPAHKVLRQGMGLIPEGRKIFSSLTVEENLRIGGYRATKREVAATMAQVYEQCPILAERKDVAAGLLSGGEQHMLAFGRALMSQPQVILMDEPSMGLAPA